MRRINNAFLVWVLVLVGDPGRAMQICQPICAYIEYLDGMPERLAGESFSMADIAAAAQISCVDYVGDVPWKDFPEAKYMVCAGQVTPSLRPILLADSTSREYRPKHYVQPDFCPLPVPRSSCCAEQASNNPLVPDGKARCLWIRLAEWDEMGGETGNSIVENLYSTLTVASVPAGRAARPSGRVRAMDRLQPRPPAGIIEMRPSWQCKAPSSTKRMGWFGAKSSTRSDIRSRQGRQYRAGDTAAAPKISASIWPGARSMREKSSMHPSIHPARAKCLARSSKLRIAPSERWTC